MSTRVLPFTVCAFVLACGGSDPSQALPGPTSATRLGLDGEVIETISYRYLAQGRLTERISSDQHIRFFYDRDDRLALVDLLTPNEEQLEERIIYRYDALDRLEKVERQEETGELLESTLFKYDPHSPDRVALREDERPSSISDKKSVFAYRYDSAGRLLKEQPMTAKGSEVQYVYVGNGVLRHRDIGDVRRIYEFDEHGNMLSEAVVSVYDETRVHEQWSYGYEGWDEASDEEKGAARTGTPYLSATVR